MALDIGGDSAGMSPKLRIDRAQPFGHAQHGRAALDRQASRAM